MDTANLPSIVTVGLTDEDYSTFQAWLEAQPEGATFDPCSHTSCLLCQYIHTLAPGTNVVMSFSECRIAGVSHTNPVWADTSQRSWIFQSDADAHGMIRITRERALEVLAAIDAR